MNIKNYLNRLTMEDELTTTIKRLTTLQQNHVKRIPFENIDIMNNKEIVLDEEQFYKKIIENNRGGICYELNGLFNLLLNKLTIDSYLIAATITNCEMEKTHACIISTIDTNKFLVDVGFGNIYQGPIPLDGKMVEDVSGSYYIKHVAHDEYSVIRIKESEETVLYNFFDTSVTLKSFSEALYFNTHSPNSVFNKKELITIATDTGRVTLTDKNILKISTGSDQIKQKITNYKITLEKYFYITTI